MQPNNYIEDMNRFRLAGPPRSFLMRLWDFDNSLVLVPSRMGFFYRLCQRRPLELRESIVNDVLKEQADTLMLASYGLVPFTTLLATVNWDSPVIFEELRRRAPWRWGGAEKFEAMIDEQEAKEALDIRKQRSEMINELSKDSWRLYNKKIGTRSHMWSPTVKGREPAKPHVHGVVAPRSPYKPTLETAWGDTLKRRRS